MGTSGVVRFTWVHTVGRCVHPGSLRSLGFAMGVVVFIQGRWVHSESSWRSLGSSGAAGFTSVRPAGRWVHLWLLRSLGFALQVVGFIQNSLTISLGVVGFFQGR